MAYIGQSIKNGTFTVLDTSGNTYNGSNTTFSLGTQVGSAAQLLVSHDGVIQKPGTDYTLASGGTQITFTTAPASGASIFIVEISGAVGGPINSDLNGNELVLDVDGDTSITADTDDQIDIKVGGSDVVTLGPSNLTVDISGNIRLDADDAGEVRLLDGGTQYAALKNDSSRLKIQGIVSDKDILFAVNDGGSETTALTIDASEAGLAIFNAGVALGGTGSANTLDDYEEGTWTPVFLGGSGNPTVDYTSQVGDYTKIGNLVYVQAYILVNTTSGGSGNLRVGGLPFTAKNSGARGFASIALGNVISTIYATQLIDGNQTYSILRKDTSGQPVAEVQVSDLANSEYLWYSGVYQTD